MYLGAVNLEVVDQLRQRNVGIRLGVAQNHSELVTSLRCLLQTGEQSCDQLIAEAPIGIEAT